MSSEPIKDDFAVLAVIDAYKWWIDTDFGFLRATGVLSVGGSPSGNGVGEMDETLLRRIARAYSVSRNIPSHDEDRHARDLVQKMKLAGFRSTLSESFPERAKALVRFVKEHPVTLARSADGKLLERELASALSKLTWFLRPTDWTIFDKFVGVAVLRKKGAGTEQMSAFYGKLSERWPGTVAALCATCRKHGLPELLGYRIVDKYLFYHGVGMFEVDAHGKVRDKLATTSTLSQRLNHPSVSIARQRLMASEQVLSVHLGDRLTSLGEAVAPILLAAGWTADDEATATQLLPKDSRPSPVLA